MALRKEGSGLVLDCQLPHLIGIDEDLLSTGIILYYLKVNRSFELNIIPEVFYIFKEIIPTQGPKLSLTALLVLQQSCTWYHNLLIFTAGG